jgi:YggT family protein
MAVFFDVIVGLLWLFWLCLLGRVVVEILQQFARDYRPHGFVLLLFEVLYTVTDPPVRAIRRVIPPLRIGGVAIDMAIFLLFIVIWLLIGIVSAVGRQFA